MQSNINVKFRTELSVQANSSFSILIHCLDSMNNLFFNLDFSHSFLGNSPRHIFVESFFKIHKYKVKGLDKADKKNIASAVLQPGMKPNCIQSRSLCGPMELSGTLIGL